MSRGESSFVAIEAAGEATVSVDLVKNPTGSLARLRAPRVEMAYGQLFDALTTDHGFSAEDAYVLMRAVAHTELGGPTGSGEPDPLHPFRAVGAVTLARIEKRYLD